MGESNSNYSGLGGRDLPPANDPLANAQGFTVNNNRLPSLPTLPGKEEQKQKLAAAREQARRDEELLEMERQRKELERLRRLAEARQGGDPGLGCRAVGCGLSIILLLLLAAALYVFIARPANIVDPLKTWVNADLQPKTINTSNSAAVLQGLDAQVQQFSTGKNALTISEEQLNLLVNKNIAAGSPIFFDAEPGLLKVYTNVDQQSQIPLYLVADFVPGATQEEALTLSKIGTERIATPPILSQAILDALLSAGRAVTNRQVDNIIELIIIFPDNVQIDGVDINKDEIKLYLTVSTGLEGIFS